MSMHSRASDPMLDLFCIEAQSQISVLRESLSALPAAADSTQELQSMHRAIASLKGAAKITSLEQVYTLAKQIELIIAHAEQRTQQLGKKHIARIQVAITLISQLIEAANEDVSKWLTEHHSEFEQQQQLLQGLLSTRAGVETSIAASKTETVTNAKQQAATAPEPQRPMADLSMLELFRMEADTQTTVLSNGLIKLEDNPDDPEQIRELLRAAHSLKGAARMVGLDAAVEVAHLMEDVFVAAQEARFQLQPDDMDILLAGVDILSSMAQATTKDFNQWLAQRKDVTADLVAALSAILCQEPHAARSFTARNKDSGATAPGSDTDTANAQRAAADTPPVKIENTGMDEDNRPARLADNVVRVSAENLNRLQGLAGEALVESRWLAPYADSLLLIKKRQTELVNLLDRLREHMFDFKVNETVSEVMHHAHIKANECRDLLNHRLAELESYDRRSHSLSHRLHREILQARMRPFADGVQGLQRLVRDIARSLNKDVKLDIRGLATQVDRDILDKLQAPLNHMLRNAVDHGIELPEQRVAAGKPAQGTIRLEALHHSGMLSIIVQDDGCGIDLEKLRSKIVEKKLVTHEMAQQLTESELLDFMFLPNFSTREAVTELSGRGVGLDVVHSVVQELRGQIRSSTELGKGTRFQFHLPLTLSVIRALLVEIAGEPYAYPLARIDQTLKLPKASIETMEGRQYFTYGNQHIGLITAHQVLDLPTEPKLADEVSIVILGDRLNKYGIVVDKFLSERNLVVHALDQRLGKVQDISSASLTEAGDPLLIFDVDDVLRSIDLLLSGGRLNKLGTDQPQQPVVERQCKRVLVVDDSITVREVERNLLQGKGYQVEVAVDGMDGWNAVRTSQYDLIVSDIDMPRMTGFELVTMLKSDDRLRHVPVIIVSYKDRAEDRQRGLEVGADYYLTKGSFHDDTLVEAVMELIGEP